MKVSDHNSPIQLDAYVKQAQQQRQQKIDDAKATPQGSPQGPDRVVLSDQAQKAFKAVEQVSQTNADHDAKVRQVQMDVEKGTYEVPAHRIASDMLKESFENDIVLQKVNTRA
jgi:flagellar biosynthesis anti-sigma factor FlgM